MMKHFSLLLALLIFMQDVTAGGSNPQPSEVTQQEDSLKILSWNIYMLPWVAVRPGKRDRSHEIVNQLQSSDFDIIVFQEAFLPASRRIISKGLEKQYPYAYGPANNNLGSLKANSGIWVLSNKPLHVLGTVQFNDCAGIDCYARKGAMLLEGEVNGKKFQILGTHLQSEDQSTIREKQMDQIYMQLLSPHHKENVPQMICGDLNTEDHMKEHYCAMLECLDAENGEFDGVEKCSYDGVNNEIAQSYGAKKKFTLDYILFRANGAKVKTVKRTISVMKKGKKHLSDHYGVICEMKF
jgi:endonuclease/exonuclease/phosphatase family metal-dependent hydrolase